MQNFASISLILEFKLNQRKIGFTKDNKKKIGLSKIKMKIKSNLGKNIGKI